MSRQRTRTLGVLALGLVVTLAGACAASTETVETVVLRGHPQKVHIYGRRGGTPVVLSSGDGGWIHLGPQVADALSTRGFFVVGFDARAYLSSFTEHGQTLDRKNVPGDFATLATFAAHGSTLRPVLVGVSEGAGLSVLAATDPAMKTQIAGVIALGLPDINELGWRWKDSLIYVTHGVPAEPTFSVAAIVGRVAPVPLAALHATGDEFVSVATVSQMVERAGAPKRLWVIRASNHRFSDNMDEFDRRLLEALAWVREHQVP